MLKYSISCIVSSSLLVSCGGSGLFYKPQAFQNPNEEELEGVNEDEAKKYEQFGAAGAPGKFEANFSDNDIEDIHQNLEWAPSDPDVKFTPGAAGGWRGKQPTWTQNYKKAIQRSRQEAKPLLIWFSDSKGSAISKRLSSELFGRSDFEDWMKKRFSPLLVDKGSADEDDSDSLEIRKKKYYEMMVKRFSVKGSPEVLILDAEGNVHARYRGFSKGDAEFYWGRMKVAHAGAKQSYGAWREKMEKRGYRMWLSVEGEGKVFAKMVSQTEDKVRLVTPEGKSYNQSKTGLSLLDRQYLEKQVE